MFKSFGDKQQNEKVKNINNNDHKLFKKKKKKTTKNSSRRTKINPSKSSFDSAS